MRRTRITLGKPAKRWLLTFILPSQYNCTIRYANILIGHGGAHETYSSVRRKTGISFQLDTARTSLWYGAILSTCRQTYRRLTRENNDRTICRARCTIRGVQLLSVPRAKTSVLSRTIPIGKRERHSFAGAALCDPTSGAPVIYTENVCDVSEGFPESGREIFLKNINFR